MSVVAFGSLGHSPGTTTSVLALALAWPRPAIVVEADLSSTSSVLAGRFRGSRDHTVGLAVLAMAELEGRLAPHMLWEQSVPLGPEPDAQRVVPGFTTLGAAAGAGGFWSTLGQVLVSLEASGTDAFVDLGRITLNDPRMPLVETADAMVLTCGATLPDVAAVVDRVNSHSSALESVRSRLDLVGKSDVLVTLLIERARENYSAAEVQRATGPRVLGTLPWAPDAAAAYSLGAPTGRGRTTFERAVPSIVASLAGLLDEQRARLRGPAEASRR